MDYLTLKWIHIISATILFGTGLGSVFYKILTDKSQNTNAIAITNKNVVLADWIFTTPTLIIQPVTGFMMALIADYNLDNSWLLFSTILYFIAGICWLPVVVLQIKMRDLSITASVTNTNLPIVYWRYARIWFYLGIPAFIAMIGLFYLMTNKPTFF